MGVTAAGGAAAAAATKVVVVGAGYMGKGIASTLARGGASVTLVDLTASDAERAYAAMLDEVDAAAREGLIEPGSPALVRARSSWSADLATAVGGADLIVEAVFEDVEVKRGVLEQIERFARPEAVIATNTSAIRVDDLASVLGTPQDRKSVV